MIKPADLKKPAVLGALAVNLIPIIGVLFWGWHVAPVMILYWLENVIIGVFNAGKIVASGIGQGLPGILAALFTTPFFIVHYGGFCFVHGVFVWVMFGAGLNSEALQGFDPFNLPQLAMYVVNHQPGLRIGLLSIVIWQAVLFVFFFLLNGAYKKSDPFTQMMEPYGRIIILHLTIMAGGFVVLMLGQPIFGLIVLTLFKLGFDVFGEARRSEQTRETNAQWVQSSEAIRQALRGKQVQPPPQ